MPTFSRIASPEITPDEPRFINRKNETKPYTKTRRRSLPRSVGIKNLAHGFSGTMITD